jgi:hypothetical protein
MENTISIDDYTFGIKEIFSWLFSLKLSTKLIDKSIIFGLSPLNP